MMKFRVCAIMAGAFVLLCGCAEPDANVGIPAQEKVIRMWVAPNETQEAFWKIAVAKWNNSGLGARVDFTTIPETRSSEDAILTALVAGSAPDISTNIFSGFAAQLANLQQLQDLSVFDGYEELIAARHMGTIMKGWDQNGKSYVLPIYSNPTMVWWRKDILRQLGIETVPTTFDDVYRLSEKYAAADKKFGMQVVAGRRWADRWFDFISYYYATAGGAAYIKDGKAVYDNPAGLSVLTFINTMFKNGWTTTDFDGDEPLATGAVAGAVRGPWDIAFFKKTYPDSLNNIVIGPMIREYDNGEKVHTFADSKGLVIFQHSKVKAEAFAFVSWIFSNDELSLLWLEKTGLPPARGDPAENEIFRTFYQANPMVAEYAAYVDVAVPPAFIEGTIDVQKFMGIEMLEPVQYGTKDPRTALTDSVRRTDKLLKLLQ
jgi:multiple sugar transport system substrate-binding protein